MSRADVRVHSILGIKHREASFAERPQMHLHVGDHAETRIGRVTTLLAQELRTAFLAQIHLIPDDVIKRPLRLQLRTLELLRQHLPGFADRQDVTLRREGGKFPRRSVRSVVVRETEAAVRADVARGGSCRQPLVPDDEGLRFVRAVVRAGYDGRFQRGVRHFVV
uniref:(northern house mosquito) hypothetical protein n=1 Tax=Culex pipiens TaxID=7175 RepID=A0A8D8B530_CULPI